VAILEYLATASRGSVDERERARRVRLPSGVQQAVAPALGVERTTLAQLVAAPESLRSRALR
jgi:hypothetical protein